MTTVIVTTNTTMEGGEMKKKVNAPVLQNSNMELVFYIKHIFVIQRTSLPYEKSSTHLRKGRKTGLFRENVSILERIRHHNHTGCACSRPSRSAISQCANYLFPCVLHLSLWKESLDKLDIITDYL